MNFTLRGVRVWDAVRGAVDPTPRDVAVRGERVAAQAPAGSPRADLGGGVLLPGLINGHDHLGFASFPPLGRPPYADLYEWAADVRAGARDPRARHALGVRLADRLFLGGLRNLLCGVTVVVHHDRLYPTLAHAGLGALLFRLDAARRHGVWPRAGFPVRVLRCYAHAHSPGLEPRLARTRAARVPWMLHAGEGTSERAAAEITALDAAGLLRRNTVLVHAVSGDVAAVARTGAAVVWCPESNRHLYEATAPVEKLRAAGVRLALGSDSPLSGGRDALSNLAAARAEGGLDDATLLRLATHDTAAVFGLPVGGAAPGDAADCVVVDDVERLLAGDRRAVQLVVVAGRPLYGAPAVLDALQLAMRPVGIDGEERRLEAGYAHVLERLLRLHLHLAGVPWLNGVSCG